MKNITIAVDEAVLTAGRAYAQAHRMSLNRLIRHLLNQATVSQQAAWTETFFEVADRAAGNSRRQRWRREDLYRG